MSRPRMSRSGTPGSSSILYVGSRLPELSETFVYREMLGLRARGRTTIGASIRSPRSFPADPTMRALAGEVFVVYAPATIMAAPLALLRHPRLLFGALRDAGRADPPSTSSRLKHD